MSDEGPKIRLSTEDGTLVPGWTAEEQAAWMNGDGLAEGAIAIVNGSHHEWPSRIEAASEEIDRESSE